MAIEIVLAPQGRSVTRSPQRNINEIRAARNTNHAPATTLKKKNVEFSELRRKLPWRLATNPRNALTRGPRRKTPRARSRRITTPFRISCDSEVIRRFIADERHTKPCPLVRSALSQRSRHYTGGSHGEHLPRMQGILPTHWRLQRQAQRFYYRARYVFFPRSTSRSLNAYGHVMVHVPPPDATGHRHEIVELPALRAQNVTLWIAGRPPALLQAEG